ncbi:unnamed protein product [Prorocentrum cordatum]|uniref:Apple domain-containing protein n=1 Tax=Prorocentrum cordatum TaxID=2364126 RepID=A0ABN9Y4W4_9DINO|nr:unnamed protein product [Polarella glacialis]
MRLGGGEINTYYPGNDLDVPLYGVLTAEDCCAKCATNSSCYAWTYKKDTQECALKGNKPLEALTKITDPEYTSGQPTHVRTAIPLTVPEPGQNTLYCWALMIPGSMEPMLLAWEFENAQSFFRCDEYAVFSNQTLTVVPGLVSKTVASDLHCEKGGEFGTALNTEIFITVWTAVVADGRYKFHDWTVKADPDSVFFPSRLRTILAKYNEDVKSAPNGVYLNNCHRGMHGPIEVISKKAVQVWVEGIPSCQSHFVQLCQGETASGARTCSWTSAWIKCSKLIEKIIPNCWSKRPATRLKGGSPAKTSTSRRTTRSKRSAPTRPAWSAAVSPALPEARVDAVTGGCQRHDRLLVRVARASVVPPACFSTVPRASRHHLSTPVGYRSAPSPHAPVCQSGSLQASGTNPHRQCQVPAPVGTVWPSRLLHFQCLAAALNPRDARRAKSSEFSRTVDV